MSNKPDRGADERTPLINGEASSADNGHVVPPRRSGALAFFFDTKHTPGRDSRSLVVRSLAYAWHVTKVTLLSSALSWSWPWLLRLLTRTDYVNFLLVMVPVGIVAGAGHWNPTAVFTINFFAIIPLAAVLSFATEEISLKLGETMGGLLNATFGNAVELIVRSCVADTDGRC